MTSSFHGAYTVCVTPFTEDGSHIDTGALRRFLSWQIEVGVPGVIILGTTGEYLTVSDEERANWWKRRSATSPAACLSWSGP